MSDELIFWAARPNMKLNSRNGTEEKTFGKANGNMCRKRLTRKKDKTLIKRAQYTSENSGFRLKKSKKKYRDMFFRAMNIIFVSRHSFVKVCFCLWWNRDRITKFKRCDRSHTFCGKHDIFISYYVWHDLSQKKAFARRTFSKNFSQYATTDDDIGEECDVGYCDYCEKNVHHECCVDPAPFKIWHKFRN